MEPPKGFRASLLQFFIFLPYFIGLLFLGFIKGMILRVLNIAFSVSFCIWVSKVQTFDGFLLLLSPIFNLFRQIFQGFTSDKYITHQNDLTFFAWMLTFS